MKKLFVCLYISIFIISVVGQQKRVTEVPATCEVSQRILDSIHQLAGDSNIIIISRLGNGESVPFLHKIRLNIAREYLKTAWKRNSATIILTQGESVAGLGRLEFYVNGNLLDIILAKKKKNIPTFCFGVE